MNLAVLPSLGQIKTLEDKLPTSTLLPANWEENKNTANWEENTKTSQIYIQKYVDNFKLVESAILATPVAEKCVK